LNEVGGHAPLWQTCAGLDNSHLDSYLGLMSSYSVAEAKNNLPKLLDRALAGEEVTITRRGKPIARLVARNDAARHIPLDVPRSPYDVEWLRNHMVETTDPHFDSAAAIRAMRDDSRY
jgi:prevent-host-death family protein